MHSPERFCTQEYDGILNKALATSFYKEGINLYEVMISSLIKAT